MDKERLNYFMLPQEVGYAGKIYPVKLKDYDEFSALASKYMIFNLEDLNKKQRQQWEHDRKFKIIPRNKKFEKLKYNNVFDFYTDIIKEQIPYREYYEELKKLSKEELDIVKSNNPKMSELISFCEQMVEYELCRLFSIITRNEVEYSIEDNCFYIRDEDRVIGVIDAFNFEEIQLLVQEQNLVFKPPLSNSYQGQLIINKTIEKKNRTAKISQSMGSIIATVSCGKNISDTELMEYTYYRLLYDFEIINRQQDNLMYAMFLSQGAKGIELTPLCAEVDLHKNPYDNLFKEHKGNDSGLLKG